MGGYIEKSFQSYLTGIEILLLVFLLKMLWRSNRTLLELKYVGDVLVSWSPHGSNRTLLELK